MTLIQWNDTNSKRQTGQGEVVQYLVWRDALRDYKYWHAEVKNESIHLGYFDTDYDARIACQNYENTCVV